MVPSENLLAMISHRYRDVQRITDEHNDTARSWKLSIDLEQEIVLLEEYSSPRRGSGVSA